MRGGLIWPGHFHECHDVYAPMDKDGHGNFYGKYCATTWNLNIGGKYKELPLSVGLCVPESCSEKGIQTALINITHILERFPVLKEHKDLLNLTDVSCKLRTKTLDTRSIIFITFVSGFILLVVVGSGVTIVDHWKKKLRHPSQSRQINISTADEASDINRRNSLSPSINKNTEVKYSAETVFKNEVTLDKSPLTENMEAEQEIFKSIPKKQDSVWKRVLLCFSALTNGQKILNTDVTEGQLLTVHGVRFLSLTWVILGHTYIMSIHIIGNRIDVLKQMDSFPFQMLLQSPFSVDSFFLLSGFLLSYLFLKEVAKKNGKINWIYFYCHRLWRLTPAYMVVVFFYMFVFKYLGSGPFWDDRYCEAQSGTWWKYLLYINNFIPIHQMCVGWSWYLANDMQFYVISPLLLYPLWRWPIIGFSLLGAVLILTWTITGVLSFTYDLIPMFVGVTEAEDFTAYQDKMWYSFDLIYDKPYCRIAPYIIGIALGYMLYRSNQRKNFLIWWQQLIGWSVAAFCALSVVFGLYHVEMNKTTSLFYNTFCRSSFSIGLAWLIFACETGHGG
ncbi:nose resistant to fluoxetine protein 6-like [Uloborus diversus]|uniref:nose resistant to fluoxetine protein 6-like n=1 Tax=Uloborus diversus TaxID=327109 RepID=UPI00240A2583|nr:nose resistant to fluoxetine protein 6-like [Uloborus diversus]